MAAIQFSSSQYDKKHIKGLSKRERSLSVLFSDFCKEVSVIGATTGFRDAEKEFYLSSYPAAQRAMKRLLAQLASDITSVVHTGNKAAWEISEIKNNALLQQVGRNITLPKHLQERVKQSSVNALAAFEERKVNGMNLSKRVWNLVQPLQGQMELALELGLSDGKGAASLSRDVRQYLLNPDKLFRRVRDKDGILRLSNAAAAYHPGQGVYRSSYKNALRMTVTENNMAYRSADYAQWEEMPFVIGTEIGLSNNHPIYDICDELSGVYPKDFKFVGWHPFCRCFATPKLADRSEVNKWARMTDEERKGYKFKGTVETLPKQFNTWVDTNKERIARAKNLPYFLKDNKEVIERAAKPAVATAIKELSQIEQLAQSIGVTIGKPMTHEQADMKHPNPHYGEAEEYRINCQSTVVAYELRRRGLPVETYGKTLGCMGEKLAFNTCAAWLNADRNIPTPIICRQEVKKRTVDRRGAVRTTYTTVNDVWRDFMSKTTEVGRYHLSWDWKGKNVGHIITMETLEDGKRLFYDPQTGREAANIIPWIMRNNKVAFDLKKGICVYRVDTLQPNPLIVKGIVKKAGTTGVTPAMTAEQKAWWAKNVEKTTGSVNGTPLSLHEWKEKYKDCHVTPETDKSLFRKMGKELTKSSLRDKWSENVITLNNAYTKSLTLTKDALDCLIFHAYTKDELLAIAHLRDNLHDLKDAKYSYINMQRKNYKKKIADGVKHMVSYNFEYNGKMYEVKTEVIKKAKQHNRTKEIFYSLKEK